MKVLRSLATSIRTRLAIALGLMLLPLMGLAAGSLSLLQNMHGTLGTITDGMEKDFQPVTNLQVLALKAMNAPHHYLIYRQSVERHDFDCLKEEVNQAFVDIYTRALSKEKQELVAAAQNEWRQVENESEAIFNSANTGTVIATSEMDNLHVHIDRLVALLDQLHEVAMREVEEQHTLSHDIVDKGFIMAAVIVGTGLVIAGAGIVLLVRSILTPLRLLEQGAEKFGKGDLSYRVPLDTKDELGKLAATFNSMAERIKESQTKLEDLATHDGLTNLYNHREFQKRLKAEFDRSSRYEHSLALLMIDIDHFKIFNDTYGHQAGDEILRTIGSLLNGELRTSDFAARYGGEEFAIILPEMLVQGALVVAERIRGKIADHTMSISESQAVKVTVSVGVAVFPEDAGTSDELVAAADRALYAAKRDGRNRTCRLTPA